MIGYEHMGNWKGHWQMPNIMEWTAEFDYLHDLLETHGNEDVPKGSIPSYLITQMAMAMNDHRFPLATALAAVAVQWKAGEYTNAKRTLLEARHNV